MNFIKNIPNWALWAAALVAVALVFRFIMRGYDYLAYTLMFIALLIVLRHVVSAGLWRVCVVLVSLGLMYFSVVEIAIIKNSVTDRNSARDYVVVLGAAVHGTTPSISLECRLRSALEYLEQYPGSTAIVSGGQGEGEAITEAQCMFDWLTERGISPERVLREDKATSTSENLRFSFDIIRALGDEPDGRVAIVSSSYHLYRAKEMARMMGVRSVGVSGKMGYPLSMLSSYIREAFGVTHLWVFGD